MGNNNSVAGIFREPASLCIQHRTEIYTRTVRECAFTHGRHCKRVDLGSNKERRNEIPTQYAHMVHEQTSGGEQGFCHCFEFPHLSPSLSKKKKHYVPVAQSKR